MAGEITPFRIDVPETDLADLRERLQRTRWPEAETVTDWSQGVPLAYLRDLCRHWATGYDWRATEACARRCRVTASAASRPSPAGASSGSPRPGPS